MAANYLKKQTILSPKTIVRPNCVTFWYELRYSKNLNFHIISVKKIQLPFFELKLHKWKVFLRAQDKILHKKL